MFIISFSHLFHRVKIYHLSFFRYLYYSKPFLAYYASFHVLTCIIHSLNEHKKLNITPLSRFSFFDDIFLSAVKQLKSLVKVFLEKMLRTKERLLGNLRPFKAESSKVLQPNAIVYLSFLSRISSTQPTLFTWDKRELAKGANPCAPWILFEIYFKFARLLLRLFLSVVFVTRPRGLLSRERDLFRHQTFEVWQQLQL